MTLIHIFRAKVNDSINIVSSENCVLNPKECQHDVTLWCLNGVQQQMT